MLSERFADALMYAEGLHRTQVRKGTIIPYVSHLLAVTATVLEWTDDEDTAIAALLHDAVEDQGGEATANEIRNRYGDHVADLVLACTDSHSSDAGDKAPWEERKRHHLAALHNASPEVALITAADKLHNVSCMVRDLRRDGPMTLQRFREPGRLGWYYTAMVGALGAYADTAPINELRAQVAEFVRLSTPSIVR